MPHDCGKPGCPHSADLRNESCDCDRQAPAASKEVHIDRALRIADALGGKPYFTEQELALRSLAGAYRKARCILVKHGILKAEPGSPDPAS